MDTKNQKGGCMRDELEIIVDWYYDRHVDEIESSTNPQELFYLATTDSAFYNEMMDEYEAWVEETNGESEDLWMRTPLQKI